MKRDGYTAKREDKPGSIVWACNYKLNSKGTGKIFYSKPVEGMLMLGNTQESHNRRAKSGYTKPNFFVPFRKKNTDLAWSKAVSVYSRCYADSKEECTELFEDIINKEIKKHQNIIDILNKEMDELKDELLQIKYC